MGVFEVPRQSSPVNGSATATQVGGVPGCTPAIAIWLNGCIEGTKKKGLHNLPRGNCPLRNSLSFLKAVLLLYTGVLLGRLFFCAV